MIVLNVFGIQRNLNVQKKKCENGPKYALTHKECEGYLKRCQKGGCKQKICTDYFYVIDSACASLFPDKSCTTNGYQCIKEVFVNQYQLKMVAHLINFILILNGFKIHVQLKHVILLQLLQILIKNVKITYHIVQPKKMEDVK
ncbi:unnamed protein product [Paramecium sonneborni]|uniref:Uncharacterized protein n=1 Tax=Paramecium sonneborni TaxID=65129 RepID=A0A8S1RRK3_9CILI|nr:unnamed protein product [Paramecium sonneborni]